MRGRFAAGVLSVIGAVAMGGVVASASTAWTIQSTPNPTGAMQNGLVSVSCPSTAACTAVGFSVANTSGPGVTLAERWSGASWVIQSTPNPSVATDSQLNGVSCPSTTSCTAVGFYTSGSGSEMTLAERWNGRGWAIQATPNPAGATASVLSGVSCVSTSSCTAAGYYASGSGSDVTLAERWDGTSWAIQSTPNPSGATASLLTGVSCASTTACTAVGLYHKSRPGSDTTLAERWNGSSWSIQSTPNPTGANGIQLNGVSCSSATACTAVGLYRKDVSGVGVTFAERWNGSGWVIQSTRNPGGARRSHLSGVSCPSATACTAIGSYTDSTGVEVTLAERWNGTGWVIQSTPKPSGATASQLSGVSCPSTTACTAAGDYLTGSVTSRTLAEHG